MKLTSVHSRRVVSSPVQPRDTIGIVFLDTISVAWSKRAEKLAAGGVAPVQR